MASWYYFVIVGHGDNPLYELEHLSKAPEKAQEKVSCSEAWQFIVCVCVCVCLE